MAHARRRCAAAGIVQHQYPQPTPGQLVGTRGADDAGTDDNGIDAHEPMPQAKGSRSSISSVASALM
ncbi:hypothetical protein D3C84_998520 [compost metagenome]